MDVGWFVYRNKHTKENVPARVIRWDRSGSVLLAPDTRALLDRNEWKPEVLPPIQNAASSTNL